MPNFDATNLGQGATDSVASVSAADVTAAATDLRALIDTLCPDGVEWKTVGEVAEVKTGSSNGNEADEDGVYPFFVRSKTPKHKNTWEYDEEAIIIPGEGGVGDIYHYVNGKYALHQRVYRVHFTDNRISTKFEYYYFFSNFKNYILQSAVKATVISIRKPMVENFRIPVPPLAVQAKIVQILNKFTELAKELAKEKQARRTQYEYYRDWLLDLAHPEGKQGKVWDLLRTLCPDGVEWKMLGDIASISRGGSLQRKDFRPSGVPCIHYGQIYTDYNLTTDHTISFIDEACAARQKFANKNDLIMTITSENIPDICKCIVWLGQERVAVSGDAVIIRHNQDPKYLAYYLSSVWFFKQKQSFAYGTKVMHVSAGVLSKVRIPVPPLPVQAEIVRILDQFSTLAEDITAGLPAEIAARQTQYEYYRNQLLSFKER